MAKTIKKKSSKAKVVKKTKPIKKTKAVKKAPVKRAKKVARKKSGSVLSLASVKSAITSAEKMPAQAYATAKTELQKHAKQAKTWIAKQQKAMKKIMAQNKTAQDKVMAAAHKLKVKATAMNKTAWKKAQKQAAAVQKDLQKMTKDFKHSSTVHEVITQAADKFDYIGKELAKTAKEWRPKAKAHPKPKAAAPKKAAKPAVKHAAPKAATAKPAVAKPAVAKSVTAPAHPAAHVVSAKPIVPPKAPSITPHNIAQKPLTGGTSHGRQDTPVKPFNIKKDDF